MRYSNFLNKVVRSNKKLHILSFKKNFLTEELTNLTLYCNNSVRYYKKLSLYIMHKNQFFYHTHFTLLL